MPAIIRPNNLTCPAWPLGFDPTHPAAFNAKISAACLGTGNLVDLLKVKAGALLGAPTAVLDGVIGPTVKYSGSGQRSNFTVPAVADDFQTVACIAIANSVTGNQGLMPTSSTANTGVSTRTNSGQIQGKIGSGGFASSGLTTTINVPYFIGISLSLPIANFVMANLLTGEIKSSSVGMVTSTSTSTGTITVPFDTSSGVLGAWQFARFMFSGVFLSEGQLRLWAQDPWRYWQPRMDRPRVGSSAGVGTGVLASSGTGAASWAGAGNDAAAVSAAGTGAASWVSAAIDAAVLSSAGTGAASWVGSSASSGGGVLSSTGTGAANWTSAAVAAAVLNASGQGAFNGASPAPATAVAAMAGSGLARFVGAQASGKTGFEYPPGYGRYGDTSVPKPGFEGWFVEDPQN